MELLRTISLTVAGDAKEVTLDNWAKGMQADALAFDVDMPVTVGTAGTTDVGDLINLLAYFLNVVNLSYGTNQQFKPLEGADGRDLRMWHRLCHLKEVPNDFVGVAQTVGAKTFRARITYAVKHPRMQGLARRIGWAQGRTIYIKVQEGNALTAGARNLTRTGGGVAKIVVRPIYRGSPGTMTPWTPFPSFRRINANALDVLGPDGCPIAVYDENAAFAATAITKFSVRVGEEDLVRQVTPTSIQDDWARFFDAGGSDVADVVTPLYMADPTGNHNTLPHGRPYVKLVSQDVAQLKVGHWFYPDIGDAEAKAAAQTTAEALGAPVLGTIPTMPVGADYGSPSTSPIEFVPSSDASFTSKPGIVATVNGDTALSIPPQVKASGQGLIAAADPRARAAIADGFQKQVALRVPGAIATSGKGRGADLGRQGIRAHFASWFE